MTQEKTSMARVTFTEFFNQLVEQLYLLDQEKGSHYYPLPEIAGALDIDVPDSGWFIDAGHALQDQGIAKCLFLPKGMVHAELTGKGRMFVESNRDGSDDGNNVQHEVNVVNVHGNSNQIAFTGKHSSISQTLPSPVDSETLATLIRAAKNALSSDANLTDVERREHLGDLDEIERQFSKTKPDAGIISRLLEPLSKVASVGNFIFKFNEFLH
ncbi:MAG: hypothetical protein KIT79_09645 [Deltaproteobacteria bacterium]|nr:hypothetical protein [Deltaproteobacteria bacterium]